MINSTTHDDYGRKAGGYLALMEEFATFLVSSWDSLFSLELSNFQSVYKERIPLFKSQSMQLS